MDDLSTYQQQIFLIKAVLIVGSGGFIFGYDIGVISGTLSKLTDEFQLDSFEEGLVVSILYVGSILGSLFGGPLCDTIGRWKTIQIQNIIFILGSLFTGLAPNLYTLCFGRFLVGIASAISGLADVPYLMEIAPENYRGMISGQYEILVALGILSSFGLDLLFISQLPSSVGWRWAFILPSFLVVLQSIGLIFLPESPKWLIAKDLIPHAKYALSQIYSNPLIIEKLIEEMLQQHCNTNTDNNHNNNPIHLSTFPTLTTTTTHTTTTTTIATIPTSSTSTSTSTSTSCLSFLYPNTHELTLFHQYSSIIYFLLIIQTASQLTGSSIVRNYAPILFEQTGTSATTALWYNLLLGVVKFLFTLLSVFRMEHSIGRKGLLLLGIVCVSIGMCIVTVSSLLSGLLSINNHNNDNNSTVAYNISDTYSFMCACILIYIGFGLGYGPIPWIISSEMIPILIRSRILSYSLMFNNAAQCLMNFLFLPLITYLNTLGMFGIFLILNVMTGYYVWYYMIESKELLPEEILELFQENLQRLQQQPQQSRVRSPLSACCGGIMTWFSINENEEPESIVYNVLPNQSLSQHNNSNHPHQLYDTVVKDDLEGNNHVISNEEDSDINEDANTILGEEEMNQSTHVLIMKKQQI